MAKNAKTITLDFDFVEGKIHAEADGYEGNSCSLDVNEVMKDIGVVLSRRMKKDTSKDRKVFRVQRT